MLLILQTGELPSGERGPCSGSVELFLQSSRADLGIFNFKVILGGG